MNLPSHPQTEAGERTDFFLKKKKKERNECFLSDAEEEKRTEDVLFSFPFIIKQKERISFLLLGKKKEKTVRFPSPLLENRQKEKERRTSPFLLHSFPAADGMADLLLP